jgi:hypothetical protein
LRYELLWLCLILPLDEFMFVDWLLTPLKESRDGLLWSFDGLFGAPLIGTASVTKLLQIMNPPLICVDEASPLFFARFTIPLALNLFISTISGWFGC